MNKTSTMLAAFAVGLLASTAAIAGDVRIMWYSDGVEGEVLKDLLDRFMKENPGINVVLDNVAYGVVREQLPVQLEAGDGPDIARVTNLKALSQHWLDLRPLVADARLLGQEFRRAGRLDAPRRVEPDFGLHDADHADRRLCQQDAVRSGGRRPPARKMQRGTIGPRLQSKSPKASRFRSRWRSTALATG